MFKATLSELDEKKILEPFESINGCFTLRLTTDALRAFNHWYKLPNDKLQIVIDMMTMAHNYAAILDDIADNSKLREGVPAAHRVYGVPFTMNSTGYGFFVGLNKLLSSLSTTAPEVIPKAVSIFSNGMLQLHRGQGLDMLYREALTCPSEEQYFNTLCNKAAFFFDLPAQLMQLLSEDKCDLSQLTQLLGFYTQLRNDYLNLGCGEAKQEPDATGLFCEDFTEGNFSFPIIHAINNFPEDRTIFNILKQRTNDVQLKKLALQRIRKYGSLEYTRKKLHEMHEKALGEVARLGGNPVMEKMLDLVNVWTSDYEGLLHL